MRLGPLLLARTLAFLAALACFAGARADPVLPVLNPVDFNSPTGIQIVAQQSNSPILESDTATFRFSVQNNTANFLILDEARLSIGFPTLPDATDRPSYPVNVSFAPYIAPGKVGIYDYTAQTDELDYGDFGISPITFEIWMSEIAGQPTSLPPVINTLGPCPAAAQIAGPCTVITFYEPFLNPPFLVGPQHEADNLQNPMPFRVNDLPEPASLALVGIAGLGLLGGGRRRGKNF